METIRQSFIDAVARECDVSNINLWGNDAISEANLYLLTEKEIIDYYLLPYMIAPYNPDSKTSRVSVYFMPFLADWGTFLFNQDKKVANVLFGIALAHLANCGDLNISFDEDDILPEEYSDYLLKDDAKTAFDKGCYEFLERNIFLLLTLDKPLKENYAKLFKTLWEMVAGYKNDLWLSDDLLFGPKDAIGGLYAILEPYVGKF